MIGLLDDAVDFSSSVASWDTSCVTNMDALLRYAQLVVVEYV